MDHGDCPASLEPGLFGGRSRAEGAYYAHPTTRYAGRSYIHADARHRADPRDRDAAFGRQSRRDHHSSRNGPQRCPARDPFSHADSAGGWRHRGDPGE